MLKKGADVASIIFVVIAIFIIGLLFFFTNHLNNELYSSFDKFFNESSTINNSEAHQTLRNIQQADNSVWDFAFLAATILLFMVLILTAFSTRISVAFYWIYAVLSIIILALGVILSNMWQEVVTQPIFVDTITRFPITNAILGTYYPTLVTGIVIIGIIVLFGKRATGQ